MSKDKMNEVSKVVEETNLLVPVSDSIRDTLVRDLTPVIERWSEYDKVAAKPVLNKEEADAAAVVCNKIATDIKTVKGHEILSKITGGLHTLHRRWTGLVNEFVNPLDAARRQIKTNILKWETAERKKAEAEQRRLQAIADEQARKERERLEKIAEQRKTPEVKEAYREQAAQVAAPVINIAAPKTNIRRAKVWTVADVDEAAFYTGLAQDKSLRGYVEINKTRLARAKAANPTLDVPGVVFDQITR